MHIRAVSMDTAEIDGFGGRADPTMDDAIARVALTELQARGRVLRTHERADPLPPDDIWVPQLFREGMPVSRIARQTKLKEQQVRKILQDAGLMDAPVPKKAAAPKPPRQRKRGRALLSLRKGPLPPAPVRVASGTA